MTDYDNIKIGSLVVYVDGDNDHVFEVYEHRTKINGSHITSPTCIKMISMFDASERRADDVTRVRIATPAEARTNRRKYKTKK